MMLRFWRRHDPPPVVVDLTDNDADRAAEDAHARWAEVQEQTGQLRKLSRDNRFRQRFEAAFAASQER